MQYSEAELATEALGKIERSPKVVDVPSVSDSSFSCGFESQLTLDLKSCQKIETGEICSPLHIDAIKKDFPYALKSLIHCISEDVEAQKETILSMNQSRKKTIAQELENITSELNQFKPIKSILPEKLDEIVYASYDSVPGRGMMVFCSRVAYFTTIRLMLIHYWKNMGLIDATERNPYKEPNLTINQVLNKSCTNLIKEKHNWLFAKQSNYSWYKLSFDTLNEIEDILSHWEFSEESISLLSLVYERYLDENRLQKYSHYTPPLLVQFIWDILLSHSKDPSLFRMMGKNRVPKLIFDPTMGSGNFLAEAAQRMKEELKVEEDPKKEFKECSQALSTGLFGCDIDSFAHFFSEIKMLWLMSSWNKKAQSLNLLPHQRASLSLSIIHQNALKLYHDTQLNIINTEAEPDLSLDSKFGVMPLEGHLKSIHSKIKLLEKFDYCIGCPPEQILKEQREFMKELIQKIPFWKQYYESNLLYSSWFFVLGISKLREGGQLTFITQTYWPTEEGASRLRRYVLDHCKVIAMIDLGDTTPFPRYITLLEKCSSKEERDSHKIKIIKAHPLEQAADTSFIFGKIASKAKLIDKPGKIYSDDDIDIFFSGVNQAELDEKPWQQIYDTGFSQILKQILSFKTTLTYFCSIEENEEPSKETQSLMTPETSLKNQFSLYEKREETGNLIILNPKPICKESPYYLLTLLNSPVLNFWYTHNGNKKNGKKFFDPASLKMIPIRPISFSKPIDPSIHSEKMAQLESALKKLDPGYLLANLSLELTHGREEIVHDALVMMQKEILSIEKTLRRYDDFFK